MPANRETITFTVEGMSCDHCRRNIEKALGALEGVIAVTADLRKQEVSVDFVPGSAHKQELSEAITQAGYRVTG